MTQDDCYELGFVQKTHGVRGEVLVFLDVDEPEDYAEMDSVFIEIQNQLVPYFIESLNIQKDSAIVKFEETDDLKKAKELVGCKLFLPLDNLPELDDDQFYFHEIIGYTVQDEKLGELGIISNFYELPQNDVLEMIYEGKEVLIPVSDEILLSVNHDKKELITALPEGLLEIYLNENQQQEDGFEED